MARVTVRRHGKHIIDGKMQLHVERGDRCVRVGCKIDSTRMCVGVVAHARAFGGLSCHARATCLFMLTRNVRTPFQVRPQCTHGRRRYELCADHACTGVTLRQRQHFISSAFWFDKQKQQQASQMREQKTEAI